ncbi:Cue3p [Kluyveromyces lactis]|uniref:KLLA0F10571p n=1 Tax=Kluyveromyces lactis (strain ATCC 8585 / CBS 2359 / DSM 70799 / NBRC 1267 / NRRL Y-1140 / WM37) TaxID=284590 RepID=Q6CKH8_KLULA|nr:uncharacterized protein KLLA0_F10571g [Kluyveromyces lactis]CAG98269.1 KLLA0F10571p [Kluyveromyces lactis]|eukprot:XP_455561.1 uncharacterized protein KLLA0_F10571g [Kluyveromyces lactis]
MTTRYQRVLEINAKEKISLAIVKFPPFKLRAAMVEKDPVIWLHLLEVYVQHMSYLLHGDNLDFLSDETIDHLCIFVKAYVHEMSEEEGKLLSLGINADVLKQLELLRAYVLQLIKSCGLLYLKLNTESLWDITRSYVEGNATTVRSLIEGSLRPTINTQKAQLDRTYQIQQHIRYLIEANKFSRVDLKSLELLLAADDKAKSSFTDNFVSAKWVDTLESMYGKEPGSYLSDWGKKLGILSFLSCSVTHLADLLKQMSITNLRTLSMYPLLGSLLIDARFQEKLPHIKTKIPFLDIQEEPKAAPHLSGLLMPSVNVEQIDTIKELFPDLTSNQITKLLQRYDNNTEVIINNLFENPSVISSLEDGPLQDDEIQNTTENLMEEHKPKENLLPAITPKDKIEKKNMLFPTNDVPDAVRNKTLSRALSLLYDATEDERDDTYDDAEVKQASADRVSVDTSDTAKVSTITPGTSKYDKIEGYLWELLKRDKNLFSRQQRGSKQRKEMKKETNWSDEQIEGWSRMIEKSPKRAQLLEEKYIFKGNVRQGKKTFTKAREDKEGFDHHVVDSTVNSPNTNSNNDSGREKTPTTKEPLTKEQQKRKNARNEKLKSSRANHNRKAGHDKKLAKSGVL